MREYSAMTVPSKASQFPSTLTVTLNEPGRPSRSFPSVKIKPDRPFYVTDQREFIFPAAYNPAKPSGEDSIFPITPATPTEFRTEMTGLRAELSASRKGSLILIDGIVKIKEFLGFTRMGGLLSQPIVDNGTILTENRIEMPKFATYTTPVYLALRPKSATHFEISHPTNGTTITVTLGEN